MSLRLGSLLLSVIVMSRCSSLPSFKMLSWLCALLYELWCSVLRDMSCPVVVRCCGFSKEWYGGEDCDIHGLWLVLLESAKNQFLWVDLPGQHVSLCVWYGTTCSLIRIVSGIVPYLVMQRRIHEVLKNYMVQDGPLWRNLSIVRGVFVGNVSKAGHTTWSKPL
jgi:hypothetical protein